MIKNLAIYKPQGCQDLMRDLGIPPYFNWSYNRLVERFDWVFIGRDSDNNPCWHNGHGDYYHAVAFTGTEAHSVFQV